MAIRDARTQAERVASRRSYFNFSFGLKTNPLKVLLCLQVVNYDCGVIEGSFARTKMSLSDFSIL